MLTRAPVLTQAAVLPPEAVCFFRTPVLTHGAGVARGTHASAGHSVAGAAIVAETVVLAVGAPSVDWTHC